MKQAADDLVARCLGQLLRHPEPLRDIELERALVRLQAARADAAYLLLHRVLVLETALQALAPGHAAPPLAAAAPQPVSPATTTASTSAPTAASAPRSFMRDAAAVAAGVVAGQALWQAVTDDPTAGDADSADFGLDF